MSTSTPMTTTMPTDPPTGWSLPGCPRDRIKDRDAYEFFAGRDAANSPAWTATSPGEALSSRTRAGATDPGSATTRA